jgi:hypothetical protein
LINDPSPFFFPRRGRWPTDFWISSIACIRRIRKRLLIEVLDFWMPPVHVRHPIYAVCLILHLGRPLHWDLHSFCRFTAGVTARTTQLQPPG